MIHSRMLLFLLVWLRMIIYVLGDTVSTCTDIWTDLYCMYALVMLATDSLARN